MLVRGESDILSLLVVNTIGDGSELVLLGEVDAFTRDIFAAAIDHLLTQRGDLRLHLTGLSFIDVGGAAILATRAFSLPPGRRLILRNPPPELRRLLELLWADHANLEMEHR